MGVPTKLIRTGVDHVPFLGDDPSWAHDHSIELGFVPYEMIPALVGRADILVQPGRLDEFNAYRLPSKLPEFFCMGKPVILPNVNLGRFVTDGKEAILLHTGTAIEIVEKIRLIRDDPELARRLSLEAEDFAIRSFDVSANTKKLALFYERLLAGDDPKTTRRS
jgi:glycosyltransferase involved in cell wall biosynthesis